MSGPAVRWGFTLAEVLITIGIIGVIASLTIPNIVNNHLEKKEAKVKGKELFDYNWLEDDQDE